MLIVEDAVLLAMELETGLSDAGAFPGDRPGL